MLSGAAADAVMLKVVGGMDRACARTRLTPGMSARQQVNSGSKWEEKYSYSRAIRRGNIIEVAGTTCPGENAHGQATAILKKIENALKELGAARQNVIRTRMYVTDIQRDQNAVGTAHGEVFTGIDPVATMVEVKALIDPELLVEIEASAVL